MLDNNEGPRGAQAPHPISTEGLFKLDVDDEIWQDVGLDESDLGNDIPRWLGDENVREGIKALLELDRCKEEERRLTYERTAMQEWLIEEWECVKAGIEETDDVNVLYQMQLQAELLTQICVVWQDKVRLIPPHRVMPESWGPTLEELMRAQNTEMTEMVALETEKYSGGDEEEGRDDTEDDEIDSDSEISDEETELLEAVENIAWSDEFHLNYEKDF